MPFNTFYVSVYLCGVCTIRIYAEYVHMGALYMATMFTLCYTYVMCVLCMCVCTDYQILVSLYRILSPLHTLWYAHTHCIQSTLYDCTYIVPLTIYSLFIYPVHIQSSVPSILYTHNIYMAIHYFYFSVYLCGICTIHTYAEYPYMLCIWVHCTWPLCSPYTIHMLCVYSVCVYVQTIRCW